MQNGWGKQDLFKVHKNGVLSSKKTKLALLQKIQGTVHRMSFSKRDDQTWLDLCDEQLRICASQYRELKKQCKIPEGNEESQQ